MNVREYLTHSYFLVGILLGVSLIFWMFSSWAIQRYKISINSLYRLRFSQLLVLGAILFGMISPCFPTVFPVLRVWVAAQIRPVQLGLDGIDPDYDSSIHSRLASKSRDSGTAGIKDTQETKNSMLVYTLLNDYWGAVLLFGFAFFFGRNLLRISSLYRLISQSTHLRKIHQLEILVSDQMSIPFSTRVFFKAHVVLPIHLLGSRKELIVAIRHEIQHHRSGDTLWILLMEALAVLFFWNPALYIWRIKFEELQEFACDEALVTSGKVSTHDYGNCLVEVALHAKVLEMVGQPSLFGAAGMASAFRNPRTAKSLLKRRIEMLFAYQKSKMNSRKAIILGGMSTVSLLIVSAIVGGRSEANITYHAIEVEPFIQKIANQALADGVKKSKAEDGYAIVSDPMTGSILALAYYDGATQQAVDVKKAAALILPKVSAPNSLVKPLIVASALDQNKVSLTEKFNCEKGTYRVAGKDYLDHESFGELTAAEVIATSSNIGMIKISEKLGKDGLIQAVSDFGFGNEGTSSYLPGAAHGNIPTLIDHQSIAQIVSDFYIGKNSYSSPIELVQAYGALVNGGKLLKPKSFKKGDSTFHVIRQVISKKASETMTRILAEAVTTGTGQKAKSARYSTGGKTATGSAYTQTPQGPVYNQELGVAQFIGAAPVTSPRVEVYVVIDKPEGSCYGNTHAAPVFAQIAEQTLQYLEVKPDKI